MSVEPVAPHAKKSSYGWIKIAAIMLVGALLGGLASMLYFRARRNSEFRVASTFVLRVGQDRYTIIEDEPFRLKVGDKQIESVLNRRNRLKFDQNGFSFSYPSAMRISPSTEDNVMQITALCIDSPTILMKVYDLPGNIDIAREKMQKGLDASLAESGASVIDGTNKPVQRKIAGQTRTGSALEYDQQGLHVKRELYSFQTDNHIVTVVYQYHLQEADLANRYFAIVNETMK